MTVTTAPRTADYRGDGVTVTFVVPFRFLAAAHLRVVLIDAKGTETAGAVASVAGVGAAAGGTVTLATAPATGVRVLVFGQTPLSQEVDFTPGGAMPGDVVERAFDKLAMGQQEQAEQLSRAVVIARSAGVKDVAFPVPVANKGLKFDSAGKLVTTRGDFDQLVGRAESSARAAATSEQAAGTSETSAASSATNAAASATAAGASEAKAKTSQTAAKTSETAAAASATKAAQSATAAGGSARDAAITLTRGWAATIGAQTSEANAAKSASDAAKSATAAKSSETRAAASATGAKASETATQKSAKEAKESATQSNKNMHSASWYENVATTSASDAAKSATRAGASATGAKASATQAAASAAGATTQATGAAHSATAAAASATKAGASETTAKASQTAAKTSETAAKASATNAAASAVTAQGAAARVSGRFATQAQAEAGTDDNHLMTPQRTAQAIAKQGWQPSAKRHRETVAKGTTRIGKLTVANIKEITFLDVVLLNDLTLDALSPGYVGQRVVVTNQFIHYGGGVPPLRPKLTIKGLVHHRMMGRFDLWNVDQVQGQANWPARSLVLENGHTAEFVYTGHSWALIARASSPETPVGTVLPYVGAVPPHGYLLCDGSWFYAVHYPELWSVVGMTYVSSFQRSQARGSHPRVPDLRGQKIAGRAVNYIIKY